MTVQVDEPTIREFIQIISGHVTQIINGHAVRGVLQVSSLHPASKKLVPSRFRIDDIDTIITAAVGAANAGSNVYLEARLVRPDLQGAARGGLDDTVLSFGLVVDGDNDKGRPGAIKVRPSLVVETSPENFHYWYLFDRPVPAKQARLIGDAIRAATGADADTGVITQPYRLAGTPNFPSKEKQARGRVTVEPTRIVEWSGRVWDPDELLAAHAQPAVAPTPNSALAGPAATCGDESTLPDELLKAIRDGGVSRGNGASNDRSRSGLFHYVVGELKKRKWTPETIADLLAKYPNGIAAKYVGRIPGEVARSYTRVEKSGSAPTSPAPPASPPPPPPPGGATSGPAPGPAPAAGPAPGYILPTIQIRDGQLPRAVDETEKAMRLSGAAIFARAGRLVYPAGEIAPATGGGQTVMARLTEFTTDSFIEPVAESAVFQRFNVRRGQWADIDPPVQLVRMVLTRDRKWSFPRVAGIITTPTLRPDGSLLNTQGYDSMTELYLWPGVALPPVPQAPSRDDALKALASLKELFGEFSFKRATPAVDLSVAISSLLATPLRGSLPTAPVTLVRASAPGTGKSYLVDVVAMVATGRLCPVITASRSVEETEKRIGAVLLSGSPIVSLDNITHDLGGELLCQITERPIVRIRVLGRSEMPDCECHTMVFATGNNVGLAGDMVRRGLLIDLEALEERPELRVFRHDALARAGADRARYVAAALTIVRAYLAAGAPEVCGPFASYAQWSKTARAPLVWLGEPDPTDSIEEIRNEDPVLSDIREFFGLWPTYMTLDTTYTTPRIIEIAEEDARRPGNFNTPDLRNFLLKVAAAKTGGVSPERLSRWLRTISGRVVAGCRLVKGTGGRNVNFRLVKVT